MSIGIKVIYQWFKGINRDALGWGDFRGEGIFLFQGGGTLSFWVVLLLVFCGFSLGVDVLLCPPFGWCFDSPLLQLSRGFLCLSCVPDAASSSRSCSPRRCSRVLVPLPVVHLELIMLILICSDLSTCCQLFLLQLDLGFDDQGLQGILKSLLCFWIIFVLWS
ncbi:PREDICTED: uncharacterized protein LOC18609061 [Theobroma cacao]|uniref:Uncharacterized protein LOC18609061 n=1 Tax=Theobroma cacao TaxID=3641 RepID=A0AB32VGD2_THECC|nr:PREDICTED: uncharacterized protein LOC18609061 [Theobroma cacao]